MKDIYLYPNSDVLINKLGIHDAETLKEAEANYTSYRLKELALNGLPGRYDFRHFLKIHWFIFQDLYEWAGQQRKINIYKEEDILGGLSIDYADVFDIAKEATSILRYMSQIEWHMLALEDKSVVFAECLAKLWKVHCFREGNTRTTITFCCQFADEHGFPINRQLFEENSAFVRTALVAYNAVFPDLGDLSQKQHLERIVADALRHQRGGNKNDIRTE